MGGRLISGSQRLDNAPEPTPKQLLDRNQPPPSHSHLSILILSLDAHHIIKTL